MADPRCWVFNGRHRPPVAGSLLLMNNLFSLDTIFAQISAYMSDHWFAALIIIFLVAAGEAIFVVGLFVPSTVVLLGAGALVGAGKLPFLPVFVLTTLGAIAGDAISYWFGRKYRFRLVSMWPLSRYPALLEKGEVFFATYGGSSVFIGRFIPGIKSVIPGIAGMMGLSLVRFYVINCVSALAWAAVHLLPAMGVGMGLKSIDPADPKTILVAIAIAIAMFCAYRAAIFLIKRVSGSAALVPCSGSRDDEEGVDRVRQSTADDHDVAGSGEDTAA